MRLSTHLPAATVLIVAACSHTVDQLATAFSSPTSYSMQRNGRLCGRGFSRVRIRAQNDNYDDEDDDDDEDGLENLLGKKLGINIGAQLPALSPEEIEDIRMQAQATLDKAIDGRLADIEKLREQMEQDLAQSRKRMNTASQLNVQYEKQNLMEKIDRLSDEFLSANADFREGTKKAAAADQLAASSGRGVDWGSWGTVGGMDVVLGPREGILLGSVAAARKRATLGDDDQPLVATDNRMLVVVDEKKSKGSDKVMERLKFLLREAFDSEVIVDTYTPTGNIPIGGKNAQTALIFASSLNDRSSLENLLGRVLKRTAPVAGSAPGMPPSHVVIVSGIGTERTNKMPYSMQNLLGGKLDKLREIEQAIISISRSRIVGKQTPLDYTIVKFGDISTSDGNDVANVDIRPGDVLDGEICPNAAANVLLQALAYQPYARNSTLCSTGCLPEGTTIDTWNDKFLCLSGPELLRVDVGPGIVSDDAILDPKFEQLSQYIQEWSATFEGDRKGTGLTTPVLVRKSRKPASKFDGVVARSGVRILFQTTNTGDRYKSASEEKLEEKERSGGGTVKKSSKPLTTKTSKEGGVEVLVEKTTDGSIRVRARRCNMDHKTIVKEMSEGVIVKNLSRAVDAWLKAKGASS